ncbi:3-hydroxyacyl-ACP dehydratase FabZ [Thiofaba sp. EF100]|uniref:3-hydroxyacyl-ACP dehydratase FabZ n=1 Tax=Thiofaba sp. EF100 TaxID=3121274 RepID=UPI0032217956
MSRVLNIQEVMQHLPHRYPFLLVDRVLDWAPNDYLTAIKNVTFNEPYFQGHFPVRPIMPGVLITEAMAQATGILAFASQGDKPNDDSLYMLVGLDDVSFRRIVEPGDQLTLHVRQKRLIRNLGIFECEARVGDEVAASATIKCIAKDVTA